MHWIKQLYYSLRYRLTGKIYVDASKLDKELHDYIVRSGLMEMMKKMEKPDELP